MNADNLRVWIARFAAPLAFFFAATVLIILVQQALESDSGEARPDGTSTRVHGGAGLGLAIAAELVRAHGGDIRLIDGTIGATFRITIPDRAIDLRERAAARPRLKKPSIALAIASLFI